MYQARLEMIYPEESKNLSYADEQFQIAFAPYTSESLAFKAKNPGVKDLEIRWEDATIIDPLGIEMEVIFLGEEISPDLEVPPSSILKPGETIEERVLPKENIYFNIDARDWRILPIVPTQTDEISYVRQLDGEKIILKLPVQIGEEIREYRFKFVIDLKLFGKPETPPSF